MKFRFEDQPHQAAAIAAVSDLFEGALRPPKFRVIGQAPGSAGHSDFTLDMDLLAENLAAVTEREGVGQQHSLKLLEEADLQGENRAFPNFSVEMETGTGKTYAYISTALRLAELYGLRKFVILVHSVAIRAGVIKTFEQTAEHFAAKYPGVPYSWGALGEGPSLDDFTEPSSKVQFLVVGVQAIDKPDSNAVYQEAEQPRLWGTAGSGINSIAGLRPVVLIDEPQNMVTPLRRRAIATLNPFFALRYSATHRERFNLVHRLGPKQANDLGLVKRVSVKGIVAGAGAEPYLYVRGIRSVKRVLTADITLEMQTSTGIVRKDVPVRSGDNLFELTDVEAYRGLVVDEIAKKPDRIVFEGGRTMRVGEEAGVDRNAIWRDQVRHTIRQHLARQKQIDSTGHNVKVLSLFFVERVADYVGDNAELPVVFDQLFREEWVRAGNEATSCPDPSTLRTAYFASTKTGILKDTTGGAKDAELEARAYAEIIANKELILTRDNPRAFIFSHSALKEGWDNPNVFQVCFLRHTQSDLERRQQIGRGLRLPVDENGRRVIDPAVCRLTLIVDESFAEFRDGLNQEYLDARGGAEGGDSGPDIENADNEVIVTRRPAHYSSNEFAELWKRIRYKARYRVQVNSAILPTLVAASELLEQVNFLNRRANVVQSADLLYGEDGQVVTKDSAVAEERGQALTIVGQRLPDLVRLVEEQLLATKYPLQLTPRTIANVIDALPVNIKSRAMDAPDRWARIVASAIRAVTIEEMVNQISYEPCGDEDLWNADVIFVESQSIRPPSPAPGVDPSYGAIVAKEGGANLYDHVIYDSHVERAFGQQLDNNPNVRLFTKLPRRFRVRTPVGEYSPDWAIVYDEDGVLRLYLVRETKDTLNLSDLEWDEAMRIRFAKRHFAAAPLGTVNFNHTTDKDGLRI